jgi:hypothetical protein
LIAAQTSSGASDRATKKTVSKQPVPADGVSPPLNRNVRLEKRNSTLCGLSVALPDIEAMEFLKSAAGNDGHFRPVRQCERNRLQ